MCDCINQINKSLAEVSNTELDIPFRILYDGMPPCVDRILISTRKRDEKKREKAKHVFGAYCPFCGEEYAEIEKAGKNVQG